MSPRGQLKLVIQEGTKIPGMTKLMKRMKWQLTQKLSKLSAATI